MQVYKTDTDLMVSRRISMDANEIIIGDRIPVGKYTATCQKVTQEGALFLLDQYLDQIHSMNREGSNRGGYEASDLRKTLQSDEVLDIFTDYRSRMRPYGNGDLLRLPFHSEIFGNEGAERFEPDHHDQCASRCNLAHSNMDQEDKRFQDLLHEIELAQDKAERNRAAARLQHSRKARGPISHGSIDRLMKSKKSKEVG